MKKSCEECRKPILTGWANKRRFCDQCVKARRRRSDKERQKARRAANGHAEKYRDWTLLKRYGITREDYDAIFIAQGRCCAICQRKSPGARDWSVDHDHETGEVRGLLCQLCNRFLGLAQDDPEILRAAIKYLRKKRPMKRVAS